MKKSTFLLLLLLIAVFIPSINTDLELGGKKAFSIDIAKSEGYVAFIVNGDQGSVDNETDTITTCECNGEKVIEHGDGHKTPCQCINSGDGVCRCEKTVQPPFIGVQVLAIKPKKNIICFTADWCEPCRKFKTGELPKLKEAGLSVGEAKNGFREDIELVDIDKYPNLWEAYKKNSTGIPCFVILDSQRKETFRANGYIPGMHQTLLKAFNEAK